MNPKRIRRIFLIVAFIGTFGVAGYWGKSHSITHNPSDVGFAQMMIPHHQQAVEMADFALDPAHQASSELQRLATQIKAAQTTEIATMKSLLAQWGAPTTMMMDHGDMMDGMLSESEISSLNQLRGSAFDRRWAQAMIAHHRGAIAMAQGVESSGRNGDIRQLAHDIVSAQRLEIKILQRWAR